VIVCSRGAVSFGSYATSLFVGDDPAGGWDNRFTTLLILVMVVVSVIGATFVARAQSLIVIGVLAVGTARNAPETFVAIVAIAALAVVLDTLWRRARGPEAATAAEAG
jgi:hypothetical protein